MDRRNFLKALGVGGALVAAAPKLIIRANTAVERPERTIFLPPVSGGWPSRTLVGTFTGRLEGGPIRFVSAPRSELVLAESWNLTLTGQNLPGGLELLREAIARPVSVAGAQGWLMEWTENFSSDSAWTTRARYAGLGPPPDPSLLPKGVSSDLRLEAPYVLRAL